MSRKISFTQAEKAAVAAACSTDHSNRAMASLLAKMEAASVVERRAGMDPAVFVRALKDAMGSHLALPPDPNRGWWSYVGKRLGDQGVTAEHVSRIAVAAGRKYRTAVTIGTILNNIPVLLAGDHVAPRTPAPSRREFTGEDDTP